MYINNRKLNFFNKKLMNKQMIKKLHFSDLITIIEKVLYKLYILL